MAPSARQTYAFVSASQPQEIIVLSFDRSTGLLTERHRSAIPAETPPGSGGGQPMVFSPNRNLLYIALRQAPYPIVSYAVGPEGALTHIGSSNIAERPAYLTTDSRGRFLFSVSYSAGVLTVGPIDADGVAGPSTQVITTPPQAHGVVVSPDDRHVYVATMAGDAVLAFAFDSAAGRVEPQPFQIAESAKGAGPRHLALSADGRHLYCITEHHGSVITFARDTSDGRLTSVDTQSMLPEGIGDRGYANAKRDPPGAADIRISTDGHYLAASDRVTNSIGTFRIDAESGRLTPLRSSPVEATPRSFALDPAGRHLLCLSIRDGVAGVYSMADDGELARRSQLKLSEVVDWVEIVDLP